MQQLAYNNKDYCLMLRQVLLLMSLLVFSLSCAHKNAWESTMSQAQQHLEKERYEKAVQSYERALTLRPGHPEARMGRAIGLVGLSRLPQALADMNAAIAVDPRPQWRSRRGMLLYALGKYMEALEDLNAVLATHPGHAPSLAARGMVQLQLHRCADAVADLDAARKKGIPIPLAWDRACTPSPQNVKTPHDWQKSSSTPQ